MAPLTRSRAQADGTPSDLAAKYYSQRAAAGLIITEATAVSAAANGAYLNTPGIYTDRHQAKWAEIADAVHEAGGQMFVQLWHVGRMGHPDISGVTPSAPSAIAADLTTHTPSGKQPLPVPRALRTDEIAPIVEALPGGRPPGRRRRHGRRRDPRGQRLPAARVPLRRHQPAHRRLRRLGREPRPADRRGRRGRRRRDRRRPGRAAHLAGERRRRHARGRRRRRVRGAARRGIAPLDIAYLHVLIDPDAPAFGALRGLWAGPLVLNTGREVDTRFCQLEELADWGVISAAAVGRAFLANPDLIDRLVLGAELNEPDVATFYAPGRRVRRLPDAGRGGTRRTPDLLRPT